MPREAGPYSLEADWFYQPLGARYVAEVLQFDTPEVGRFREAYEAIDVTPARVASAKRIFEVGSTGVEASDSLGR